MSYLENNRVKDFVKGELIEKLENLKGENFSCCGSYVGYYLLEAEQADGVYFYNPEQADEWLEEYYYDLGEIIEEIKSYFDDSFVSKLFLDFFNRPDWFVMFIIKEVSSCLLSQCKTIDDNWGNEIELTNEIIDNLIKEIEII